jgi:hypothetical protein
VGKYGTAEQATDGSVMARGKDDICVSDIKDKNTYIRTYTHTHSHTLTHTHSHTLKTTHTRTHTHTLTHTTQFVQQAVWAAGLFWTGAALQGFDPRTVQHVASRYTD